jgi:hypothetical protein
MWVGPMKCTHHEDCPCDLTVIFRSDLEVAPVLIKRYQERRKLSREEMMQAVLNEVQALFHVERGVIVQKHKGLTQEIKIRNAIRATGCTNIREIPAPTPRVIAAKDDPMKIPALEVEVAAQNADVMMFSELYGIDKPLKWYRRSVFAPLRELSAISDTRERMTDGITPQIPSLLAHVLAGQSLYNKSFGGTNNRPHVISAMKGMEDEKVVRIIAKHARNTDVITDKLKEVLDHVPEALDYMYSAMDTVQYIGTVPPVITMERVKDLYLGASSGTFLEEASVKKISENENLVINASGKKIHAIEPVLRATHNFWTGNEPIPVIFTKSWKTETKYDWVAQLVAEAYHKFLGKARTFEIGNMFFIIQEKVCQTVRMLVERWNGICIGMKWAKGGAQEFANQFKMEEGLEYQVKFDDGDFTAIDQTEHYVFLQLFYTMGGIYFDPKHEHYDLLVRILDYVAKTISARVVHLCNRMWAIIVGEMPTGAWMTSHGNSWIVLLYFFLFCVMQSYKMQQKLREHFQRVMILRLIQARVYGDDHVKGQKRNYEIEAYIGEKQFAMWVETFVGGAIRDVRQDVPFISEKNSMGDLSATNLVMLKQYFVRNRNRSDGQPAYLPYRMTKDIAIRCIWGSTVKKRDKYDLILSSIGHGYGTYGANYQSWLWLKNINCSVRALITEDEMEASLGTLETRAERSDFTKKMRMVGITVKELLGSFPSWKTLQTKNIYDAVYHISKKTDTLYDVKVA